MRPAAEAPDALRSTRPLEVAEPEGAPTLSLGVSVDHLLLCLLVASSDIESVSRQRSVGDAARALPPSLLSSRLGEDPRPTPPLS